VWLGCCVGVCDVLQSFAMFCDVLWCFASGFAMFCNVLRCLAMFCNVLRRGLRCFASGFAMFCDVLRRVLQFRNVKPFVSVVVLLVCCEKWFAVLWCRCCSFVVVCRFVVLWWFCGGFVVVLLRLCGDVVVALCCP